MNELSHSARLPTELLRIIILHYLATVREEHGTIEVSKKSHKAPWCMVEPLTLTSRTCRRLALEGWFEVYFTHSPNDLLEAWPEFSTWTKELHCVEPGTDSQILPVMRWNLTLFHRLRKLRVDFEPSNPNAMLLLRFDYPRSIASQLQELELHDISWPSPMPLTVVAGAFHGLRVFKMSQDLIWCDLCNICRFATFKDHPPEQIVYEKIVGLPSHYTTLLKRLIHLQTVVLTIGYGLGGSECDACMDMMYSSKEYCEERITRKAVDRPPSLQSVIWRFRQRDPAEVVMDFEDEPELYVAHADGYTEEESDTGGMVATSSDD
ncbi:hypothetical protein L227DRAFT_583381 [Lentinus tigrinus ALCF2SS1-6]|uniref:Uncharacterized protein n=1 Tax=Lentinus tigrinus ALCF2SS1-6 TaxID=1328759 RepID=A0A5C2SQW5_9APHY|nr:hypothetical protein L227DRAFT_583381 [Lentinus tigrinus ALCF2SS1-6]